MIKSYVDTYIYKTWETKTIRESSSGGTAPPVQQMINSRYEVGDSERLCYRVVHTSNDGVVGLFGSSVCTDGDDGKPAVTRVTVLGIVETPIALIGIAAASPRPR